MSHVDTLNGLQGTVTLNSVDPLLTVTTNAGTNTISLDLVNIPWKPTNEWYVAKNGNDGNNGGPTSPFLTIQAAINAAQAFMDATWRGNGYIVQTVFIAPGVYFENVTITTGFIRLCATPPSNPFMEPNLAGSVVAPQWGGDAVIAASNSGLPCVNLNITTAVTNATQAMRKIVLEGLTLVNGSLAANTPVLQVASTASLPYALTVQNCTLTAPGRLAYLNPAAGAATSTHVLAGCNMDQTTTSGTFSTPAVECARGSLAMQNCSIAIVQNAPVLAITGAATMNMFQFNNFFSSTTASAAEPIIRISSTTSYVTPISNNVLSYTGTPSVPRPSTSCAIEFGGATAQSAIILNNLFMLLGTTIGGYAIRADTLGVSHLLYAANNYSVLGQARLSNVLLQTMTPILNETTAV